MPRPAKPARLWLHQTERVWIILDRGKQHRTGCDEADREGAENALTAYLASKFQPRKREGDPSRLSVAEVLIAYGREHAPTVKAPATIGYCISALGTYWGDKTLDDVRKDNCREYAAHRAATVVRGSPVGMGTIRRELGTLQAAINYWHETHGPLASIPVVTLPQAPPSRTRWLTRTEAAMLLAGALGFYREAWCDVRSRRQHVRWRRDRGRINRHLARFIVLGLATGTRRGALLELQWMPNTVGGWIDVERGVMHRRAEGQVETKKRRPPARLGKRVCAHLRRWKRLDDRARAAARNLFVNDAPAYLHIVAYRGDPVQGLRTAWANAVEHAYLDDEVTPHVLRHTRATWAMQRGIDVWEVAGYLGMSVRVLEDTYGHHHPDFQKRMAEM